MISLEDVSFSYTGDDQTLNLKHIDLRIAPGECVLLCGKSGCGKTTITKLINGLIPHFDEGTLTGQALVNGHVVADTPLYTLSQQVGSVFQNPKSQFFNIDSDSELAFGLENNGVDPDVIRARIAQTVQDLHIEHLLHRNVFSMSGGEKQSLAFASVYAMNPNIYILDEPSANLDQAATEALRTQIRCIKAQGKSIVVAEHRLYYLADLIDRVLLVEDGKISQAFDRAGFLAMTEEERHQHGLRTIHEQTQAPLPAPPSEGALEIRDLSVRVKKHTVFEHVHFSANRGSIIGIVGHNGAGKTTLMRCLAGLIKAQSGEIRLDGKALSRKERNAACYMIMQDVNHQLFGESVWEECLLARDDSVSDDTISDILEDFNLLALKDKHPMALSGGQKQRLAIASGLVAGKQILIFDEPTSGLDYAHMRTVSRTLKNLAGTGHIVLVVTHDLEFLNSTCDQIFTLGTSHQ